MDFKITCGKVNKQQRVLLYREYDEDCQSEVNLLTYDKDGIHHSEVVTFHDGGPEAANRYIEDFSPDAADEFINRFVE